MKKQTILYSIFLAILLLVLFHSSVNAANLSTLGASTFLGGSGKNEITAMAIDQAGNVIVAGYTDSGFPTTVGAYDTTYNGPNPTYGDGDGFVAKFTPDLSTLLASTYIGGSQGEGINAIFLDNSGNVIVAGLTYSKNFPTSANAFSKSLRGYVDGFVTIFSSDLSQFFASTYIGGDGTDIVNTIALDNFGNIFVAGSAEYALPVTVGAHDTSHNGSADGFIAKFNSTLSGAPVAMTYVGGQQFDTINDIKFATDGKLYAVGDTVSNNFPVTLGAYDVTHNDNEDGFIFKIDPSLTGPMLAATYIGGSGNDSIRSFEFGLDQSIFLVGDSSFDAIGSTEGIFPITPGAFDSVHSGAYDGFIANFNTNLTNLIASTYFGGSEGNNMISSIVRDGKGNMLMTGRAGKGLPVTTGVYDTTYNGEIEDTFVAKFNSSLSPIAVTYLGGSKNEQSSTMVYDSSGKIYIAGLTESDNFPVTQNAYDKILNPNHDAFVAYFVVDSQFVPLSNPPEVKKGSNLQIIASGSLPDLFISSFNNVETNATVILAPIVILEKNGYTLVSYNTNELVTGTYTLKIKDEIQQTIIAESQLIQVVPEKIVFKLNAPKTSVIKGSDVVVKVYPGLYAYDKLVSSEYAIIWKDSKGNTLPVVPSVWPSKGFTLLLPFVYNTSVIEPGTYKIELRENKKLGQLLASTFVTIIENELGESMQPAYNPRAFAQYQQSLKKGRPLVTR